MNETYQALKEAVVNASKIAEKASGEFIAKKRELFDYETILVNAREDERKARENLRIYEEEKFIESSREDHDRSTALSLKEKLPDLLKKIECEKPIDKIKLGDLL